MEQVYRLIALMRCVAVVVVVCTLAVPAQSADPMDALRKATKILKTETEDRSQDLEAFDQARATAVEAWTSLPFFIRKIVLTEEKAIGSGMYKERRSATYKTGELVYVYLEPVGYGWKEAAGDLFSFGFVADVILRSDKGEVVLDKKGLIDGEFTSHNKNMEAYMSASIEIESLSDGVYTLEFTVHDKSSTEIAQVTKTFTYENKK